MYRVYLGDVRLPVAPSELQIEHTLAHDERTLLDGSALRVLEPAGLSRVTLRALLPNTPYPFAEYAGGFQPASAFVAALEALRDKSFLFRVERGEGRAGIRFPACLDKLTVTEAEDVTVTLTVSEYRPWAPPRPATFSYTVAAGDTLWNLARRFLGDGERYTELFSLNADKLTRPGDLPAGVVLRIPEAVR